MKILYKKEIKCAIYTRKSTEEGLAQDFNSLDAQREACESYIKSQQHEGWALVEKQYNDGGFSGGTLERPAIKELFKDIEFGDVDIVVVYKVDRLTRSLMDFSKIVELFDKHSASFVSVTQHFNTTTSMGRLTLNVLLSFAQFEREVTGERIRDKVAASKKKGLWTGGAVPIGYRLQDKKLIADETYLLTVKTIYEKYLEFKSVLKLKNYLDEKKIKTRTNRYFSKGNLYQILSNKIYIGLVTHKSSVYQGEHEGIIKEDYFNSVQEILRQNRVVKKCSLKAMSASLLAGKLFDDRGNRMNPSHSNTRKRRYRYYVSQAIIQFRRHEAGSVSKIPAGEIEKLIKNEISSFVADKNNIQKYISEFDIHKQKGILSNLEKFEINNVFIRSILAKVVLYKDKVEIILCSNRLIKALESLIYNKPLPEELKNDTETPLTIIKVIKIVQSSRKGSILIISRDNEQRATPNDKLIKAIVKSYYWNNLLLSGECKSSIDVQKLEGFSDNSYIKDILRLRFLAPSIIEAILSGSQSADVSVQKLFNIKTLDWQEQKQLLGL